LIATLTGQVQQVTGGYSLINVGGMGFQVFMPLTALEELAQTEGEITVYTYLHHKEDTMVLFGFLHPEDKALFEEIITVSGIGPKTALAVLSVLNAESFRWAILNEQAKELTKVPGIGLKSAQRMILELKSKIQKLPAFTGQEGFTSSHSESRAKTGPLEDAVDALVALGYQTSIASEVVEKVWRTDPELSVSDLVRSSLKQLMK